MASWKAPRSCTELPPNWKLSVFVLGYLCLEGAPWVIHWLGGTMGFCLCSDRFLQFEILLHVKLCSGYFFF